VLQVSLYLIELHLMRQRSIVQLREDVNALSIIDVKRIYSEAARTRMVQAFLLDELGRRYLGIALLSDVLAVDVRRVVKNVLVFVLLVTIELLH
jgi:hypothetical protein